MHHSGWAPLPAATKAQIQAAFAGRPVTVELGYDNANFSTWQAAFKTTYLNLGITPSFITLNAFSNGRVPVVAEFQRSIAAYRAIGVPTTTLIFATFEFQNFAANIPQLSQNTLSKRRDFQDLVTFSKGMVIDSPSIVFFRREQAYRDWIVDAVKWSHSKSLQVGIIFSPNSAGQQYDDETLAYLKYLAEKGALPDLYFVENYSTESPDTYPNIVGTELVPYQQVGCARLVQDTVPTL